MTPASEGRTPGSLAEGPPHASPWHAWAHTILLTGEIRKIPTEAHRRRAVRPACGCAPWPGAARPSTLRAVAAAHVQGWGRHRAWANGRSRRHGQALVRQRVATHARANDPAGGVVHAGPLAEGRGEATRRVPPSLHKRTSSHDRRESENAYGT